MCVRGCVCVCACVRVCVCVSVCVSLCVCVFVCGTTVVVLFILVGFSLLVSLFVLCVVCVFGFIPKITTNSLLFSL